MPINAQGYFNALRSYLNTAHYEITETDAGRIVLREKGFISSSQTPVEHKVRLAVSGEALVIKLDQTNSKGGSDPLFHFLDNNGKPWSKRCDFVVFHRIRERINVLCFEFKSETLPAEKIIDQLVASEAWCHALHSTIKHYTGNSKRLHLTKFVLFLPPQSCALFGCRRKIPSTRPFDPSLSLSGHRRIGPRHLGQHQRGKHQLRPMKKPHQNRD